MLIDGHRGHPAHRDCNFWALPRAADGYGRAGRKERRNSGGRRPLDRGAATQTLRPEVPNSCNPDRPEDEIIVSLGSEVCRNLSHALALSDAEGAPAIAVTATDARRYPPRACACCSANACKRPRLPQRLPTVADILARRSACRRPHPPQRPLHPRGSTRRSHATPSRNCQTAAAPEPCRCIRTTIVYPGAHSSASGHPEDSSAPHRITPG